MKRVALVGLVLTGVLASCGQQASIPTPNSKMPINSNKDIVDASVVDPVKTAQYLVDAGFSKADALSIKESLNNIKNSKIASQNLEAQASRDADIRITQESMDLILNGTVNNRPSDVITTQAARSEIVQAAKNISLYSMSNFLYYQGINYLFPSLDYFDDGCTTYGTTPAGSITFRDACDQHDFGYRNGLYAELHNGSFKLSVDTVLLSNSKILCGRFYPNDTFNRSICTAQAEAFYVAVRAPFVNGIWQNSPSK